MVSSCAGGELRVTPIEDPAHEHLVASVPGMMSKSDVCLEGRCVASATTAVGVLVSDLRSPQPVATFGPRRLIAVRQDPNNEWLLAAGGNRDFVHIFDLRNVSQQPENNEIMRIRSPHTRITDDVSGLQYSPLRPGVLLVNFLGPTAPVVEIDTYTGEVNLFSYFLGTACVAPSIFPHFTSL